MTGMSTAPLPEVAIRAFLGGGVALAVTLALMPLHLRILRALRVVERRRGRFELADDFTQFALNLRVQIDGNEGSDCSHSYPWR